MADAPLFEDNDDNELQLEDNDDDELQLEDNDAPRYPCLAGVAGLSRDEPHPAMQEGLAKLVRDYEGSSSELDRIFI